MIMIARPSVGFHQNEGEFWENENGFLEMKRKKWIFPSTMESEEKFPLQIKSYI